MKTSPEFRIVINCFATAVVLLGILLWIKYRNPSTMERDTEKLTNKIFKK